MEKREYVRQCEQAAGEHRGGGWIIQIYHGPTGSPWVDQECPHFYTRAAARAAIIDRRDTALRVS